MAVTGERSRKSPLGGGPAFDEAAEPYRRELKVHCYRMLGSLHEAEDAVQETYLRAWRSFDGFDGRGSFRGWLYRIATNVCLDELARRRDAQRRLPDQVAPATAEMPDGRPATEIQWLEPYPGRELEGIADDAPGPEARYTSRQSVELAFVAVIQQLPPRQRAALLLCDVLGWSAAETATLLQASSASINSALQRARATLATRYPEGQPPLAAAPSGDQRALLDRYLEAWERVDVEGLVSILKEDATYTMPPFPQWYVGREAIGAFLGWALELYEGFRLFPTTANAQPAFLAYSRTRQDRSWHAHSIQVLALDRGGIAGLTLFAKPESPRMFGAFGFPVSFDDGAAPFKEAG